MDYRAYPLVDHIADKVTACLETHARSGGAVSVSSRYKDLVDLVLIARTQQPVAADLRRALLSETGRRGVGLPAHFVAPGPLWPAGYEAKATEVPQLQELGRFPAALALVKAMLDPVLAGTAVGRWDPVRAAWGSLSACGARDCSQTCSQDAPTYPGRTATGETVRGCHRRPVTTSATVRNA